MRSELLREGGLPPQPVAAASLCQVYKLETASLGPIAVKIQRPGIRAQICTDLFLLRVMAMAGQQVLQLDTDWVALVDEYGSRLVDELDFSLEARTAQEFAENAAQLGLDASCTTVQPIMQLTTSRVLVTSWVDGERLESVARRDPQEAKRLQGVAMSAYLTMLLELGTLHADPHVGNLLRASDGRLIILDWGLVAQVGPTLRRQLLMYITHVLAKDYAAVPADLVALGFIVQSQRDVATGEADVARAISEIFRELASGGSARRRVADIMPSLGDIRQRYGSIGQIPPAFVYILRTFSILEGNGLQLGSDYRIVEDCYPYLLSWASRADGPEVRQLLLAVLYGAGGRSGHNVPAPDQVLSLLRGLTSAARLAVSGGDPQQAQGDGAGGAPRHAMRELSRNLRPLLRDTALREVLLDEAARAADVVLREAMEANAALVGVGPAVPGRTVEDRAVLAAFAELAARASDEAAEGTPLPPLPPSPEALLNQISHWLQAWSRADFEALFEVLSEAGPQLPPLAARFVSKVLQRASQRSGNFEDSMGEPSKE